jgi:cytochrome b
MADSKTKILVWDAPVRVFHWLMVLSFFGAYLTAESERWRLMHVSLGYTLGGLVAFRILWGLMGTRYARFASFVPSPSAVMRYVRSMFAGRPEHHVGHNPAGAVAIVLLLLSSMVITASGWAIYNDVGGKWLEESHEVAANFMLLLVGVHVAGVLIASWLHRENLVRAMVTGKKEGTPGEGIRRSWRSLAAIMLVAVLGFWWLQWQGAPTPVASATGLTSENAKYGARGHDDDD